MAGGVGVAAVRPAAGDEGASGRDAEAIAAILGGDVERYAELVERYRDRAVRMTLTLLGNAEDARDAAQEAFVQAYRGLARFRGEAAFSTWFYRIVVNVCHDARRRRSRQPIVVSGAGAPDGEGDDGGLFSDVPDPAAGPREQAAERELARRLSEAIETLTEHQRTVFVLHHLHGVSLDEVAGVMGCRLGTVKSHLFRATERVRAALAPWHHEAETYGA